jgi:two-component system NarL family sensor kinase
MKNSELYTIIISGVIFFVILSVGVIQFTLLFYRQRSLRKKEEEKFQQEILRAQLEIQEQTLKNVSVEIHDNIGQTLSLVKLNLATADVATANELQTKIHDSYELVSKAIRDLRNLSKSINTDYIAEKGLLQLIEHDLNMIARTGAMQTEMTIKGEPVKLDPRQELILFRIIQESFNNCIKHAQAERLETIVDFSEGVIIRVRDNGKGFDMQQASGENAGLGLKSLQNRAALIGASCEINSVLSKGTEVTILLPPKK